MEKHRPYSGPLTISKLPAVKLDKEGNMVEDREKNPLKNWVVLTDPLNFRKVLYGYRQTNALFISLIDKHTKKIEAQKKSLALFATVIQKLTDIKRIYEDTAAPSTLLLHLLKYFAETTQKIHKEYELTQTENIFIPLYKLRILATPESLRIPETNPNILLETIDHLTHNMKERAEFGYDRIKADSSALHYFKIVYNISAGEERLGDRLGKLDKVISLSKKIRDPLRPLTAYNIIMFDELVEYFYIKWVYRTKDLELTKFVSNIKYVVEKVEKDVLFGAIPLASGVIGQWTQEGKPVMPGSAFIQCIPARKTSGHYYEHTTGKINGVYFYMNIGPTVGASSNKTIIAVRQYGLDYLQLEITFDIKDLINMDFKGTPVPIPIHCSQGREWVAAITSYTLEAIKPMVTIHVKGGALPSPNTLDFKEDLQKTIGEFSFTFAIDHWRIWREKLQHGRIPTTSRSTQLERVILWKAAAKEMAGKGPLKDNIPPDYGDNKIKRHIRLALAQTSRSEMVIVHKSQYDAIMNMPL
jgi:hypothetical protein